MTSLSFLSFFWSADRERFLVFLLPFLSSECFSTCLGLQFYQFYGLSYPLHLLYPKLLCLELFGGRGFSALPTGHTTLNCITVATWDRTKQKHQKQESLGKKKSEKVVLSSKLLVFKKSIKRRKQLKWANFRTVRGGYMNNQVHRKVSTFTSHQVNENSTHNEIILYQFHL